MQGCLFEHSMHNAATHSTCLVSQQRLLCVRDLPEQHPGVLIARYNLHWSIAESANHSHGGNGACFACVCSLLDHWLTYG